LIGEHTDYNDGFTLPLAINRYTTVVARRLTDGPEGSCFRSSALDQPAWWTSDGQSYLGESGADGSNCQRQEPSAAPMWSRYVAGVVNQFSRRGFSPPPLELQIDTTVPLGGGVSSSAALEVAVAMVIQKVLGIQLDGQEIAGLCQAAEHLYAGVPCGLMDQLSSVFGRTDHLMLMDCRHHSLEFIAADSEIALLVVNSRVKHRLADGEYRQRRQQCEEACRRLDLAALRDLELADLEGSRALLSDVVYRRSRHVVTENFRTVRAAAALKGRQWPLVGDLMYESHQSMRDDYQITCPEIDLLVSLARDIGVDRGVWGARMTGGGFGGCVVILADQHHAQNILQTMEAGYFKQTGIQAESFATRPAAGALELAMTCGDAPQA